jgi:hypothetical protein
MTLALDALSTASSWLIAKLMLPKWAFYDAFFYPIVHG